MATAPAYLRPFALFAFICGFANNRSDLRYHIENQRKEWRNYLISMGNNDQKSWAYEGNYIINSICEINDRFGVLPQELKLVWLFESNIGRFHEWNKNRLLLQCLSLLQLFFPFLFFHIYFEEMINDTFKVICGINFRNFGERLKLFDYFHLFAFSISFSHSMRNSTIYMIDLKEQTVWILHVYCSYLTLHHFPHSSSLFPFFSSHSHP